MNLEELMLRMIGVPDAAERARLRAEAEFRERRVRNDLEKRLHEQHGEFWSVEDVASYFGVDQRRIREDIKARKLTSFEPTGGVRGRKIHYMDLCDYIMKHRK